MNPFNDNLMECLQSRIDEEIYSESLKQYSKKGRTEFDEIIKLVSFEGTVKESTICYHHKEKEYKIRTDKPYSYWFSMTNKRVHLKGTVVKDENAKRLIVLRAISEIEVEGENGYIFSEEEIRKYDSLFAPLNREKKKAMYTLASKIQANSSHESSKSEQQVRMSSLEELKIMYKVMQSVLPDEVKDEIERCFEDSERGSSAEKQNCKKVLYYLLNLDWIGVNRDKLVDVSAVRKALNETHIGMEYPRAQLLKLATAWNQSENRVPEVILLVGTEGCGKTSLAKAFFKAMGKRIAEVNLASVADPQVLSGSGRIYENGKPGLLFSQCFKIGTNGGFVLEEVDKLDAGCMNTVLSFIDKSLMDNFLEVPIDISRLWIICTANSTKNIPAALLSRMTIINVDEYTDDEKEEIINKILIPRMCQKYNLKQNGRVFSKEVTHQIMHKLAGGNSIRSIAKVVEEIFRTSIQRKESFPEITSKNISQYYNWGDLTQIRNTYVRELAAIQRKIYACGDEYPAEVKKRNYVLLEMVLRGTDEEKNYAISALQITANILNDELEPVNIRKIRDELDKSHYGLENTKEAVLKTVASSVLTKERKVTAILMDGCPGVGKTSICQSVASALGRKFVKISLNGVASSETIKGFSRTFKDSQAGIIVQKLSEPGVGSYSAVVLLDEVDKMVKQDRNDPYTTLHDLLDNNGGFYDQYLETTIPTENILWILTSNDKSKIPASILDRVNIIDVKGYSVKEKKTITKDYVVPKIAKRYNLDSIEMEEEVLNSLLNDYCISYGVRDVEMALESLIQKIALKKDLKLDGNVTIRKEDLVETLGAKVVGFNDFPATSKNIYGQARALAVAGNYGSTFAIQVVENPYGEENIEVTGLAKGSFAESIKVAKTLVCNKMDCSLPKVHIHALDSGIEKDGPSAGLTLFSSLMSFVLKKPLPNVAFTGTVDLFGNVGVIGGTKLKLSAAEKAGVETVYLPKENYERLVEDGEVSTFSINIRPVSHVNEVMKELFGDSEELEHAYGQNYG